MRVLPRAFSSQTICSHMSKIFHRIISRSHIGYNSAENANPVVYTLPVKVECRNLALLYMYTIWQYNSSEFSSIESCVAYLTKQTSWQRSFSLYVNELLHEYTAKPRVPGKQVVYRGWTRDI